MMRTRGRESRRRLLRLAAGLPLAVALAQLRTALAAGALEKGVYRASGEARINGVAARPGMDVKAGDVVTTGADGEIAFVIARDAMLVRKNSRVEIDGVKGSLIATGLRIVTGKVLSVFSPGERKRIATATATIGIRGTAVYVESEPDKTYVCTCYGVAELEAAGDPAARETVSTKHHEQPRYVMSKGAPQMLMTAPVFNHSDAELIFLESLVGREPPFYG
ncbi:MAG: FecR domain-containing protein, partial [Betaproteobacteria bacterium]|nr:FecR domain-containing protein [Betaproteobacteria bacterium]